MKVNTMSIFFKKKSQESNPDPSPFKKEKLSDAALEHFVEAYQITDFSSPESAIFELTTRDGRLIQLSGRKVFATEKTIAKPHFYYLMGQTYAYHKPRDPANYGFHLGDLMYIVDKTGNKVLWTHNKQTIIQFAKLAEYLGVLILTPEKQDPKNPKYGQLAIIKPVIHTDPD